MRPLVDVDVQRAHARSAGSLGSGPGREFQLRFVADGDELLTGRKQGRWYRLIGDSDAPRWIHDSLVQLAR